MVRHRHSENFEIAQKDLGIISESCFLCDIVHRDFKSLALISYYLEKDFDITTHIIGITKLVSEVKRLNDVTRFQKLTTPIYQLYFF